MDIITRNDFIKLLSKVIIENIDTNKCDYGGEKMSNNSLAIYTKVRENIGINKNFDYQAKKETIIALADEDGYSQLSEYVDIISNSSEYCKMLEDAKNHKFDKLMVIEYDGMSELDIEYLEYNIYMIDSSIEIEYFYDLIESNTRARNMYEFMNKFWMQGIELKIETRMGRLLDQKEMDKYRRVSKCE